MSSDSPVHEVQFGGDEGSMTLVLAQGPVGDLVCREARLVFGPLDAVVRATLFFDPAETREAVSDLLQRNDLTGEILLVSSEHGEFSARVALDHGRGALSASIETQFATDGGATVTLTTDQTQLAASLRQLDRIAQP